MFPVFAFKFTHRVILLTRFCELLTRVATPSGGGVSRASSASMARRLCPHKIRGEKITLVYGPDPSGARYADPPSLVACIMLLSVLTSTRVLVKELGQVLE